MCWLLQLSVTELPGVIPTEWQVGYYRLDAVPPVFKVIWRFGDLVDLTGETYKEPAAVLCHYMNGGDRNHINQSHQ